jgi:hypothetical protein
MRRLLVILVSLGALAFGGAFAAVGPAAAQVPSDDPGVGLVYDGLQKAAASSLCGGAFEAVLDAQPGWMKQVLCTHGPDPAPEGVDVRQDRAPDPAELTAPTAAAAAQGGTVPCYGDGSDGYRVQLVYAHSASGADRFANYSSSFLAWAARLDGVVNTSAGETGGTRHVRFVTDSSCNPVINQVTLSPSAMSSFSTMVSELHTQGFARTDRKYLVWSDANVYCGISELYVDDSASAVPGGNYNNGNSYIQGSIGRVDNGCWGQTNMVEAHELLHLLGGVQPTAPHATPGYHCTDESDRLCYADGSTATPMQQVCPTSHEALYDCNHDDYFSTAPPPGSYLSTHWNTASSAFLSGQGSTVSPIPTTTPPSPTTTTVAPTTTTVPPPTTTTVAPTTTSVAPPTTAGTVPPTTVTPTTTPPTTAPPTTAGPTTIAPPPGATRPSAPQAVRATQPGVGSGVLLSWQPPTVGTVTGYRIYRGTSQLTQTLLATVSDGVGYQDTSAGRTVYFYRVTAFNGAGEGPASTLVAMIGKLGTPAGVVREDVDRRLLIDNLVRSPFGWPWS